MTLVFGMKIAFIYNHLIAKIKQPDWSLYFFGICYMATIITGCLILIMRYFLDATHSWQAFWCFLLILTSKFNPSEEGMQL